MEKDINIPGAARSSSSPVAVLLQPPGACRAFTRSGSIYPPLGLCQLAATTSPQQVAVLDADGLGWDRERTWQALAHLRPALCGMTVNSYTLALVQEYAAIAEDLGISVMVGGPHASLAPVDVFSKCPSVTYAVRGEGEAIFPELIERATRQTIEPLRLPSAEDVNTRRLAKFKARIGEALAAGPAEFHRKAVQEIALETGADLLSIAAAIATLVEGHAPVQSEWRQDERPPLPRDEVAPPSRREAAAAGPRTRGDDAGPRHRDEPSEPLPEVPEGGYAFEDDGRQLTWRLAVGRRHGALPGSIVGAIANEARLHGTQINGVDIRADYTLVRLPANLPDAVLARLAKVRVRGQALDLQSDGSPRLSPQLRSAKPRTADYGSSTRSKSERAAPRRPPAKRPPGKGPPWGKPRHRD
jgi:hypothetical protein